MKYLKKWMSEEELVQCMTEKMSVRKFNPDKPIPQETLNAILETARLTSSACGSEPWKFIMVTNKEIRIKLGQHKKGSITDFADVPAILILCKRKDITAGYIREYTDRLSDLWNMPSIYDSSAEHILSKNSIEKQSWIEDQVYIALGQVMASCAILGVDCLPMEQGDKNAWDEILGLQNSEYTSILSCGLGTRADDDMFGEKPKARKSMEEVCIMLD